VGFCSSRSKSITLTDWHQHKTFHHLRSASTAEVLVLAKRRSTIGDRALAIAGPRAWNDLPVDLRLSRKFSTFKTHLKSHLFNISFPSVWLHHWLFYRALEVACAAYAYLNLSLQCICIRLHDVTVELLKSKCLPSLYYGLEACPLSSADFKSLEYVVVGAFMKIFNTRSKEVATMEMFNFPLSSVLRCA